MRRRLAGALLALALAGVLSAGVAVGVERMRHGRKRLPEGLPIPGRGRTLSGLQPQQPPGPPPPSSGAHPRTALMPRGPLGASSSLSVAPASASWGPTGANTVRAAHGTRASSKEASRPDEDVSSEVARASGDTAGAGSPVPSGLTTRLPAPMRVGWTVEEEQAGRVRLAAGIERRAGFHTPIDVRVELPAGARLVEGLPALTLAPGTEGAVQTLRYVVAFESAAPPPGDLVLFAHAEGASFGAHAEARYGFGRVAAAPPRPSPGGLPLPDALLADTDAE